jgi:amino acid adenylation domain-containing protein
MTQMPTVSAGAGHRPIPRQDAPTAEQPASFAQEQLWFIDEFHGGLPAHNVANLVWLRGTLDEAALGRALDGVVARHEALRTRLEAGSGGRPVQVIDPPGPVPLPVTDVAAADAGGFATAAAGRPFTLAKDWPVRAHLLRAAAGEHALLLVIHQTAVDRWSLRLLLRELAALYQAEVTGEPAGLAAPDGQFAGYARAERERLAGPAQADLAGYWRDALAGFETSQFPTDRPRPRLADHGGAAQARTTSPGLLAGLQRLARGQDTTLAVTLLAGLQALLSRYTGQTDVVIGVTSDNRDRPELAPLVGFLAGPLPVRCDLSGDPAFTDLLGRVHRAVDGARAHQDLPFARIVDAVGVERDPGRFPIFQIGFSCEEPLPGLDAAGVRFQPERAELRASRYDVNLVAEPRPDGLWLEITYPPALFDAATVERLLGNYEVLLGGAAADASTPLSRLPVLTVAELHRELVEWNDTATPFPPLCIHEAFAAQVKLTPDAVAAQFEDQTVSYAELDRWAGQIAHRLRGLGVGPEVLAGVCMRTGLRRLAAFLGIWKAGGGYVPLDPALPAGRLSFMIADTGMKVVLTDEASAASVPRVPPARGTAGLSVMSLDAEWEQLGQLPGTAPAGVDVTCDNVAYVLYTSGSTGKPKGVLVEHRQVVAFARGMIGLWQVTPADAVLQFASLSFDVSVLDMFVPLLSGARVVLAAKETLHSPPRLAALMRDAGITFACLTPSVLSLLSGEDFPDLRLLMTAGEELPGHLAQQWLRPGLRLVNGYGPTETTVIATSQELDADSAAAPPIGLPMPNYRAYVLDPQLNPVPAGVTGELHIGGAGVARGYLNRPELTRQRFIPDPFAAGQRLYKSGDLVRRRADGSIVFLGRIDNQVKIRGLRIELGEVEAALASHPAVAQAVAVVQPGAGGEQQLTAYLRPQPGSQASPAEVRAHLARFLPAAMIPAQLLTVADFPLNTSRKIDKTALPAPTPAPAGGTVPPASPTEVMLAGLYGRLLGTERVGATDSFFDLGGNSLQAMRLVDMIHDEAAADVGVTSVFLHPTPRQLARQIDAAARGTGGPAGPLADLSQGAGEVPLLLIHPVGGTVSAYTPLAGELAGTFRVRGLAAPALAGGALPSSLATLAGEYTRLIRAAQPSGPYRLAGWSMGGVLAFEVARRLQADGAGVALLVLLDAPFRIPDSFVPERGQLAARFLADVAHSLGWDTAQAPDPASSTVAQQLAWLTGRLSADGDAGRDATAARLRRRFEVFEAHSRLLAGYQPAGPLLRAPALLVGADGSPNAPALGRWPEVLAGPVTTLRVASDHYSFLRPPLVAGVGTAILTCHADSPQAVSHGL